MRERGNAMSEISSTHIPPYPTVRETVRVKEEFVLIEVSTWYRGKTNSYVVERMSILAILDKLGQAVTARWEKDWIEIAPGIETRGENSVRRTSIGIRSHEFVKTGSIRIHRHACPVYVHFLNTQEYNDYYDSSFSTSDSFDYWVRYDA
jgi:hypothetical protein